MRRTMSALVTAAAALPLAVIGLGSPAAAAGSGIDWGPCPGADAAVGVECATIVVPLDYDRPRGETIEIGLARRPASDQNEKIGTVLMDPGGPGVSGVKAIINGRELPGDAAAHFDFVGFDPRGVNTSTQVRCGQEALLDVLSIGVPADETEFSALADANAALTEDCRERTGELFDHVSNLETVEDIERIRRALGEDRLNFLGYSYGTLMGQQYAEEYPRNIRTMVLDANMDHSLESTWDYMSAETATFEENFAAFAAWCGSASGCALHGEDIPAVYAELKASARSGDLLDPYTGEPLDFYALTKQYTFGVNYPQSWQTAAATFAAMRDGTALNGAFGLRETAEVEHLYYPAWCQDWGWEVADYDELASLQERLAATYANVEWTPYDDHALTCIGSGIEHTNERDELDVSRSAPPIVFVGNLHDPATAYAWSATAAEQVGGHLITYEGFHHKIYGGISECVDAAVNAYLIRRDVPEPGLSCPNLDFPEAAPLHSDTTLSGVFAG